MAIGGSTDVYQNPKVGSLCSLIVKRSYVRKILINIWWILSLLIVSVDGSVSSIRVSPEEGFRFYAYRLVLVNGIISWIWSTFLFLDINGIVTLQSIPIYLMYWKSTIELVVCGLLTCSTFIAMCTSIGELNRSVCSSFFRWCLTLEDICVMKSRGYILPQYGHFFAEFSCPVPKIIAAFVLTLLLTMVQLRYFFLECSKRRHAILRASSYSAPYSEEEEQPGMQGGNIVEI